jgi:dihydrofolate synthase/folylpolyglutamate synthase
MTYPETLDYLFSQLPMYQRVGQAAYKADLKSTVQLMSALNHPEHQFKSIHVAGTNGKGSTSHLLASIFQEAGYNTGLYTSPHLIDFRERIRINGEMISQEEVSHFVDEHKKNFEPLQLSFFEWSVGLAFDHFSQHKVDIAIIEVGMGGRLDSTNVVSPELSIITNIGWDHAQFLGDNLDKIAQEKAGIIKPKIPVIVGRSQRETEGVFRRIALAHDSTIIFADQQFPMDIPPCPLKGNYQAENFQTVLIASDHLRKTGWRLNEGCIKEGFANVLKNTSLRGRWEIISERPKTICDVGHNKDGITAIIEQLKSETYHHLHLVLGFVSDKNVEELLNFFPKDASLYLTQPSIPRAMPLDRLEQIADQNRMKYTRHENVGLALKAAKNHAKEDDLIFIGGSTFVVADLLAGLN